MRFFFNFWKNTSIANKLYSVVGIMAILIAGELLTLHFAMNILSAVRAFVGGEGLWSKAQKDATISLQNYAITRDEKDFQAFQEHLKIPEGDHRARQELLKQKPDLQIVRQGFLDGKVHPDDIDAMVNLLRRFYWVSYLDRAIRAWTEGDEILDKFKEAGMRYHDLVLSNSVNAAEKAQVLGTLEELNSRLTVVETEFSNVLGEGSRWLERIIISLLFLAVITVESIGISLTFFTSRSISRGLSEISSVADAIGRGHFERKANIQSRDEIGALAKSVNAMGTTLQNSYRELEERVKERTAELAKAVRARDEFLSIASHELKTPLTVLQLQTQIRKKMVQKEPPKQENLLRMWDGDERQVTRLVHLVDDMLDISRLNNNKLLLHCEDTDLSALVSDVVERLAPNFIAAGCAISTDLEGKVQGHWDGFRLEQMLTNLLTNAMKYSAGKPVHISLKQESGNTVLSVKDEGIGIAAQDHERIFGRFERAATQNQASGFGVGLYIVKEIVEAHGGKVQVESEPGKGANFSVVLQS